MRETRSFREESLRAGAWQGRAGRGGDGEDQGDESEGTSIVILFTICEYSFFLHEIA